MLNPSVDYVGTKARVKFNGGCLKQEKITFNHWKIVSIYIAYEIERSVNIGTYLTLENCLFGPVKLTKHADIDLYKCSGYGIGFDNKKKDILILGKWSYTRIRRYTDCGKILFN